MQTMEIGGFHSEGSRDRTNDGSTLYGKTYEERKQRILERMRLIEENYLRHWDLPDGMGEEIMEFFDYLRETITQEGLSERGSRCTARLAFIAQSRFGCAFTRLGLELQLLDLEWADFLFGQNQNAFEAA